MVFVEQSLASPYGRGAPNGGGEGPLSHGCAVTAPPKGEPRSLRDKHQFIGLPNQMLGPQLASSVALKDEQLITRSTRSG